MQNQKVARLVRSWSNSMDMDPGIICFQHCNDEAKIFCFELPLSCYVCGADLATAQLRMLPFRIPYPFVRAEQHPCSIVIKPTKGDFLNDYMNSMDLHIGVTNSVGEVLEYDRDGLHRHRTKHWNQCLVIEGLSDASIWSDAWDSCLEQIANQSHWSPARYQEESYNCYTFVLTFLRALQYNKLSKIAMNKTAFCEKFIIPRTTAAGKYISLYRKLRDRGWYIHR